MARAAVLLSSPSLPSASAVERALRDFELDGSVVANERGLEVRTQGALLRCALRGFPVANAEADTAAFLSLSAINGRWMLGRHAAHLELVMEGRVLTAQGGVLGRLSGATREASPLEQLSLFTRAVSALSVAAKGLGVHWPAGPVTHAPDYFHQVAREAPLPLPVWLGVSLTPEPGGRSSLLSFGMKQFSLPELLLAGPGGEELADTVDFFFSALATIAERGAAPSEGETIPRSLLSRPKVRYGESPVEQGQRVWKLEL